MTLVEFVPPTPHPLWKLCPQMGITDVVVKVNPELTGLADPWRYETLSSIVSRLKSAGLNVVGLEGDPFDMTPIKEYGSRKGREEQGDAPSRCAMWAGGGAGRSTSLDERIAKPKEVRRLAAPLWRSWKLHLLLWERTRLEAASPWEMPPRSVGGGRFKSAKHRPQR